MTKPPIYYIIQIDPPKKYIVVNYSYTKLPEEHLKKIHKTNFKNAVLRNDLIDSTPVVMKDLNGYCKMLSQSLSEKGFITVSGAGLMNDYWQLYVIRANTADSKLLYVGSSHYPREMRFEQHAVGWKSADIFGENIPHSLDNDLFDSSVKYFDGASAEDAEEQLAAELRKQGFDAEQA